ncbi:MAG: BadF/BadG/BcrA/BcrD ATPase family protein [Parvibaculaceae bacterium]
MTDRLFLGIDGGGTKCRARIRTEDGALRSEAIGGLANIYSDFDAALRTILETAHAALRQAGHGEPALQQIHVGLGLAGVVTEEAAMRVRRAGLPFAALSVDVDAYIACLGAHDGRDGGIVIAGTGSSALALVGGKRHWLGGWGFPLGDDGSGAILGRAALRRAALAFDGMIESSPLLDDFLAEFGRDRQGFADWALNALPRDYARFSPRIFAAAAAGDHHGVELVEEAARGVAQMVTALIARGAPSIALIGGLARPVTPYLPEKLRRHLIEPHRDPLDGAIIMARRAAGLEDWSA